MPSLSIIQVQLSESDGLKKEFSDMNLKLNSLSLPQGAGPIKFNSDFGDTAALMLTVASPLEDQTAIAVRSHAIEQVLAKVRATRRAKSGMSPVTIVYCFPEAVPEEAVERTLHLFTQAAEADHLLSDTKLIGGPGFVLADAFTSKSDRELYAYGRDFVESRLHESEIHPDTWPPIVVREPEQVGTCWQHRRGTNIHITSLMILRICSPGHWWELRKFPVWIVPASCRSRSF